MNPLGQRVLDRWDGSADHDDLTPAMLDRALRFGWISADDVAARR